MLSDTPLTRYGMAVAGGLVGGLVSSKVMAPWVAYILLAGFVLVVALDQLAPRVRDYLWPDRRFP